MRIIIIHFRLTISQHHQSNSSSTSLTTDTGKAGYLRYNISLFIISCQKMSVRFLIEFSTQIITLDLT
jgi:hypothetical protein